MNSGGGREDRESEGSHKSTEHLFCDNSLQFLRHHANILRICDSYSSTTLTIQHNSIILVLEPANSIRLTHFLMHPDLTTAVLALPNTSTRSSKDHVEVHYQVRNSFKCKQMQKERKSGWGW